MQIAERVFVIFWGVVNLTKAFLLVLLERPKASLVNAAEAGQCRGRSAWAVPPALPERLASSPGAGGKRLTVAAPCDHERI
ncbi:hypothetical protein ACFWWT_45115 [Streptomyces sp. NPDC058676]|uniref:hypothetical protein n=1 Tax=unclassified Streptomyces TaxID=2593676 RepID=UPI00365615B7